MPKRKRAQSVVESSKSAPEVQNGQSNVPATGSEAALQVEKQRYTYRPLRAADSCIRIIELLPGKSGDPLKAFLGHERIERTKSEGHHYEAISYAWGDPIFDQDITIEGRGTLRITTTLHVALQHLRFTDRRRRLWVDALCINQSDVIEKAQQVLRMLEIFRSASKTLIWLGTAYESDKKAFLVANAAGALGLAQGKYNFDDLRALDGYIRQHSTSPGEEFDIEVGLFAVCEIMARPWWSRLWVVQEVAGRSSTDGICFVAGHYTASWKGICHAVVFLRIAMRFGDLYWPQNLSIPLSEFDRVSYDLVEVFEDCYPWGIRILLERMIRCSRRRCSLAHDRIYAIYGWLELDRVFLLTPDYNQSIGELYRDFMWNVFQEMDAHESHVATLNTLNTILSLVGTETPAARDDTRPSWVPHFHYLSARSRAKWHSGYWKRHEHTAQFSGELNCSDQLYRLHDEQRSLLTLKGTCFATVEHVLSDSSWSDGDLEVSPANVTWSTVEEWYDRCKAFAIQMLCTDECADYESTLDQIFRCGNSLIPISNDGGTTPDTDDWASWETYHDHKRVSTIWSVIQGTLSGYDGHADQVNYIDRARLLCLVVNGLGDKDIAWVPSSAVKGDRICVFAGSPYPYLLRETWGGRHTALGDVWTAHTTLQQALGGQHKCKSASVCGERPRMYTRSCRDDSDAQCNRWDSGDAGMHDLIANMGWIILQ